MSKAVFLDRDGVINKKSENYIKTIDEFELLKDVPKAIQLLKQNNFLVIIITNQSAINRGFLSHEKLEEIHNYMEKQLLENNTKVDVIYYCPHTPEENCQCRKPNPGLLIKAIKEYNIDVESSWFIGDSQSDMDAAKSVGINQLLMKTDSSLLEHIQTILNSSTRN